ncbi:MAG: hypothetical protein BGO32_08790 [Bacteroidetes bacterium 37-13]|nr:MAG: hypothetical protein BGO32_08790 [Bacteroidetes bacterium 37-13]
MNTAYIEFDGKLCVAACAVKEKGIVEQWRWDEWVKNAKKFGFKTRPGGNGRPSLIELNAIPQQHRERIIETLGNPAKEFNALEEFFTMDAAARAFYDKFRHTNGKSLEPFQISKYTINASVLNALAALRTNRETMTKRLGNPRRDLTAGLAADCADFNNVLKLKHNGLQHNLPKNARKLNDKLNRYIREGYNCLIDGRANNTNAQVVTREMIQLWNDIFAGQRKKPTHFEVSAKYNAFLSGKIEIVNGETGELHNPKAECYKKISESSVYNYLSDWDNRIVTHLKRAGDRQKYMGKYIPHASMEQPAYSGSIISVDDRQPPYKWGEGAGNRMWFYMAQDLGSQAFTAWVHGDTKDGIIIEFYRQLVRNYTAWGLNMPNEIECESSLNSSFAQTFLSAGAMFQAVHIIPNMARSKRIERTFGELRNNHERQYEEFMARPHAKAEHLQSKPGEIKYLPKDAIVERELKMIEDWNNQLHPNQQLHPGMSRWDVLMDKQHPDLKPTNWHGILPHLGYCTKSSMALGRIMLQGKQRVIGFESQVALGDTLLNVMSEIEGEEVQVFWLDDNEGKVLKAHVHNMEGRFICELLDELPFHRAKLEQTDRCRENERLTAAYRATVEGYAHRMGKAINQTIIIENEQPKSKRFSIAGIERRTVEEPVDAEIIETIEHKETTVKTTSKSLYDRF